MPNEIDILMDLDPLELSKDPQALDALIAHYRNTRAKEGADGKPQRKGRAKPASESKPTLALADILSGMTPKGEAAPKAPASGGIRRI